METEIYDDDSMDKYVELVLLAESHGCYGVEAMVWAEGQLKPKPRATESTMFLFPEPEAAKLEGAKT